MRTALLLTLCAIASAQQAKLSFEVVSIKPSTNGSPLDLMQKGLAPSRIDDAHVELRAITMTALLTWAFHIDGERMKAPDWVNNVNYDVLAKIPAGRTEQDIPEMLQSMLAERFGLRFHHEEKILPVYELKAGSGTLKMKESVIAEGAKGAHFCIVSASGGHHACRRVSMDDLAHWLWVSSSSPGARGATWALDLPIINATGVAGFYDFDAEWGASRPGGRGDIGDPVIVPITTAVRELGLKLEPAKHAFDYMVIDHLERVPTEN